jgi:uracil-DNA glycosylase
MKNDFKTLKELHEYYAVNNSCKLKSIATQPVYEIVPPSSGIVFIGEAPGRNEDLQGKPFVGAAGKFLNELLGIIGYTREDVYVSNTVKYRPPENREPTDTEKESCRVWLNAELIFIKPKVIVTLGRHALVRFVPKVNITASHGKPFSHPSGIPIFPMYHPAAALYNPNLRETLKEDIKKLKNFLDNGGELQENIFEDQSSFSKQAKEDIKDILSM